MLNKDIHKDEVCINGRFVYTVKRNPLEGGHTRTTDYIDGRRRLDARFARDDIANLRGEMIQLHQRNCEV